ncbi:hypothetical protein Dimus_019952 [Dionaea muscipula]
MSVHKREKTRATPNPNTRLPVHNLLYKRGFEVSYYCTLNIPKLGFPGEICGHQSVLYMNSRTSAIHVKHTVIIRATTATTQQGPKSISIYRVPSTSSSLAKVADALILLFCACNMRAELAVCRQRQSRLNWELADGRRKLIALLLAWRGKLKRRVNPLSTHSRAMDP